MDDKMRKALAEPFAPDKVKTKPGRGGSRLLTFVSHGLVTERLNAVDPGWSCDVLTEHIYRDQAGRLHCEGVTIALTVGGVRRVEVGGPQRQDGFANEIKNAYSDALKRAAMRFGVALSMWESLVDAEGDEDYAAEAFQQATHRPENAPNGTERPDTPSRNRTPQRGPQGRPQGAPQSAARPGDLAEKIAYASSLIRGNGLDEAAELKPFLVSDVGALTEVLADRLIDRLHRKVGAGAAAPAQLAGMAEVAERRDPDSWRA